MNNISCLVYLDDIILFSQTIDDHLSKVVELLTRLRQANLKLKGSKCYLLQREIEFLGHVVTCDRVSTNPAKVQAVRDWPVPTNATEVRSFVSMCSYYRRFIKGFASIATALHQLTAKGQKFKWTEECQSAFEQLKTSLITAPVFSMPTKFVIDCDASSKSLGAVLSQMQNGEEKVIAYSSRTLRGPELNYCVTHKELLSVVFFVRQFRPYLLGRRF